MITSSDKVFEVSRRAMFALRHSRRFLPSPHWRKPQWTDPLPAWKGKS